MGHSDCHYRIHCTSNDIPSIGYGAMLASPGALCVIFRYKTWIWKLTLFASNNYTTIWNTVYGPRPPSGHIIAHETIHSIDQKRWTIIGLPFWILLYVLFLPLIFNPLRYRTEYKAYRLGSMRSHEYTTKILASWVYGFMPYWLHFWVVRDLR